MLAQYFGFREEPFGATPDPRWLYRSAQYREALASLRYGFYSNRGFSALIAPPGLGKTTLLYQFLHDIRQSARIVFLFDAQCGPQGLLRYILRGLGITPATTSDEMHMQLEDVLVQESRAGRTVVIVVDEAQNLSDESLEMLRLLTNYETPQAKLLHIVLSGQPELAKTLTKPSMEQLRQRVTVNCWLEPFSVEQTTAYIRHRLEQAGYRGAPLFRKDALKRIMLASHGVPRIINNLCFNALSLCREQKLKQIDYKIATEAIAIQELDPVARKKITDRWLVGSDPAFQPRPAIELPWEDRFMAPFPVEQPRQAEGANPPVPATRVDAAPAQKQTSPAEPAIRSERAPLPNLPVELSQTERTREPIQRREVISPAPAIRPVEPLTAQAVNKTDTAIQAEQPPASEVSFDQLLLNQAKVVLQSDLAIQAERAQQAEKPVKVEEPVRVEQPQPAVTAIEPEPAIQFVEPVSIQPEHPVEPVAPALSVAEAELPIDTAEPVQVEAPIRSEAKVEPELTIRWVDPEPVEEAQREDAVSLASPAAATEKPAEVVEPVQVEGSHSPEVIAERQPVPEEVEPEPVFRLIAPIPIHLAIHSEPVAEAPSEAEKPVEVVEPVQAEASHSPEAVAESQPVDAAVEPEPAIRLIAPIPAKQASPVDAVTQESPAPEPEKPAEVLEESEDVTKPKPVWRVAKIAAAAAAVLLIASGIGQVTLPARWQPWTRLVEYVQSLGHGAPPVSGVHNPNRETNTGGASVPSSQPATANSDLPATGSAPDSGNIGGGTAASSKTKPSPGKLLNQTNPVPPQATSDRPVVADAPPKPVPPSSISVSPLNLVPVPATPSKSTVVEPASKTKTFQITVAPNQTLREICVRYLGVWDGKRLHEIQALNPQLTHLDHLQAGQKINLPAPEQAPLAQPSSPQSHQSHPSGVNSDTNPTPTVTASTIRIPVEGIRSPAEPAHKPVATTGIDNGNHSGTDAKDKGKVAQTSLPVAAGTARQGGYGKVASAGIPDAVKGVVTPKKPVAPVPANMLSLPTQSSDPSAESTPNCGGINEIPCPTLSVRSKEHPN